MNAPSTRKLGLLFRRCFNSPWTIKFFKNIRLEMAYSSISKYYEHFDFINLLNLISLKTRTIGRSTYYPLGLEFWTNCNTYFYRFPFFKKKSPLTSRSGVIDTGLVKARNGQLTALQGIREEEVGAVASRVDGAVVHPLIVSAAAGTVVGSERIVPRALSCGVINSG